MTTYHPSRTERTTECFIAHNPERAALEGALRNLAHELAELRGELHDNRNARYRLNLGDAECDVEYEYLAGEDEITSGPSDNWHPGEPESVNILGVFVNGMWIEPDVIAPAVIEQWQQEIIERLHDEAEGDRAEYESMRRDERYYG
jgi:hypothetical protein